jgi:hypothetical protein
MVTTVKVRAIPNLSRVQIMKNSSEVWRIGCIISEAFQMACKN